VTAEVEGERGQPGGRLLLAHQSVVLLAAAGSVADEESADRRTGGQEEPAREGESVRLDPKGLRGRRSW